MEVVENWSISIQRMREYFEGLPEAKIAADRILLSGCCVILVQLPDRTVGKLQFPCTRLEITGEEKAVNRIYHQFYLRFLSAGG